MATFWASDAPRMNFATLKTNKEGEEEEEGNVASSSSSKRTETRTEQELILNKRAKESEKGSSHPGWTHKLKLTCCGEPCKMYTHWDEKCALYAFGVYISEVLSMFPESKPWPGEPGMYTRSQGTDKALSVWLTCRLAFPKYAALKQLSFVDTAISYNESATKCSYFFCWFCSILSRLQMANRLPNTAYCC